MTSYSSLVNRVIDQADLVLMVLDARRISESLNMEIAYRVRQKGKKLIYVINKCDLIPKGTKILLPLEVRNSHVLISAQSHYGTMRLLRQIMKIAEGKRILVGVLGIPNTGKSTLINALKGRHSAPTSSTSGYTRAIRNVRINQNVTLIDTPGVLSKSGKKGLDIISIGAISPDKIKDLEAAAEELIREFEGGIEAYFGVKQEEDPEETLAKIALKRNFLKKGGLPDSTRIAKEIIKLCQKGSIQ